MKAFIYKDELYIKVIPGKNLFKSTMVHEVINRGDIFAVRLSDSLLTILDGTIEVEHTDVNVTVRTTAMPSHEENIKARAAIAESFDKALFQILFKKK